MIRAGKLNNQIEIQAKTYTSDGLGSGSETWATVATVWAEIWALRGDERISSAQLTAAVTHRVRIRAYPGLTTAHRLLFGTRVFDIRFVNNVNERGAEMVLDCLERAQ